MSQYFTSFRIEDILDITYPTLFRDIENLIRAIDENNHHDIIHNIRAIRSLTQSICRTTEVLCTYAAVNDVDAIDSLIPNIVRKYFYH